jgi:hypothetical protein
MVILAAVMAVGLPTFADAQIDVKRMARNAQRPLQNLQSVEIVLERTTCFGTCVPYVVRLCGDGSVHFTGDERGVRKSVTRPELYALLNRFYQVQFFDQPNEFDYTYSVFQVGTDDFFVVSSYTTDLPSTYVSLTIGDRTKRVHLRTNIPPELEALAAEIDRVVRARNVE